MIAVDGERKLLLLNHGAESTEVPERVPPSGLIRGGARCTTSFLWLVVA